MNTSILKGRKIFLVDATGGLLSALSLLIPYAFEAQFGMPKSTVIVFIAIAIACSLYSTVIHVSRINNWKPYLTVIALVNISYCLFTTYHVFQNKHTLTPLGYAYFTGELLIILTLSFFELKLSRTPTNA